MTDEARRAPASFALHDAAGAVLQEGQADAVIGDADLGIGPISAAHLDIDGLRAADYRIELDLWPDRRLTLTGLGRRHDTFTAALRRARNQARVAGLLAHGPAMPEVFTAALIVDDASRPAELQVYPTHLTIVAGDTDPYQVPFGALTAIRTATDPPTVTFEGGETPVTVGHLGRQHDRFCAAVTGARDAQARLLAQYTGETVFADGRGVPRADLRWFEPLLARCAAAERLAGARTLLAAARGGEPRLGFAQLLDPDAEGQAASDALPKDWASFLLVPAGRSTALEILAGPSAATYLFDADIDAVNRDLMALHFRRGALALTAEQAVIAPGNPHRLALRRLAPLQRLRAATRARLVHADGWADALAKALASG